MRTHQNVSRHAWPIQLFFAALFFCALSASAQTINITFTPYNASTGNADNASAIQAAINAVMILRYAFGVSTFNKCGST